MDVSSDQESVESSSSDEGSENEMADIKAGLKQDVFGTPGEQRAGSSGAWEDTLAALDSGGEESDDGDMVSAVASANQQASKFLEDSDSEEETMAEPRTDLENVFGDDSDEEAASLVRAKRGLGSEREDRETPPKRIRVDSAEESEGEESGGDAPVVIALDSDEETPANKEVIRLDSDEEEDSEVIGLDDEETTPSNKADEVDSGEEAPSNKEAINLDSDEETPANKEAIELDSGEETPTNKETIGLDSGEETPTNKKAIRLDSDEETPSNKEAIELDSDGETPVNKEGVSGDEGDEEGPEGSGQQEEGVLLQEEELVEEGVREEEGEEGDGEQGSDEEDDKRILDGMTDWDLMMSRRKEAMARARARRKKRKDGDLTVNDDHVMALIQQMREAAQEDRKLNIARKAATKKIQLLSIVMGHMKKADLQTTLVECGILSALAEWLTPLPDHSLPHLKIRESILDMLMVYAVPDSSILKSSKIGKAIMLLYRHPKEAKKNKEKAGRIINEWVRPIFGLASDFKSMTRVEREERDYANLSQEARHRISSDERRPSQDDETELPQKPGDKGWVGRARVPMPSTKGYVVRPKWNTDQEFQKRSSSKKPLDRYEKHMRKKKQEKMQSRTTHAVTISVEGRHMPL